MDELMINGQTVPFAPGDTILEAANKSGITIPTLCYHEDLTPYGGCQLCLVEVAGERRSVQSCTFAAKAGLVVQTETPAIQQGRRAILEMLLSNYYEASPAIEGDFENELLHWAHTYQVPVEQFMRQTPRFPIDSDPNPFIYVDLNKCIMCTRCVRACAEDPGAFCMGGER